MDLSLGRDSVQVLVAFGLYLAGVAALAIFSHRYLTRGSFVKEYFLGNRGLGGWVLALTIAATAISGGTFMGFPSLIYTNGWVMALWIASYMIVPLMTMVLLGKRINQVARIAGSVTVPDVFRDRFNSPALGVLASSLILLFLAVNLVAQFRGGGLVLKEAMRLPPDPCRSATVDLGSDDRGRPALVVVFVRSDGTSEAEHYPLPEAGPVELDRAATVVDTDAREVRVAYRAGDKAVTRTVRFPAQQVHLPWLTKPVDLGYLVGLVIFALTVVGYTTFGGFWAVTWTDVLEGLVMLAGVLIMAVLAVGAVPALEDGRTGLAAATEHLRRQDPHLVYGPGPNSFLPLGMAFSFFLVWSLNSPGQPSGMVRLMSFKDTPSLRKAVALVAVYYALTYLALLVIFVCARAIFPNEYLGDVGSEGQPDSIMPAMVRHLTQGAPAFAGLLLAAPYAAIMSTVAAFLLLISSSLVRDLYQRTFNPAASQRTVKLLSYLVTGVVGLAVTLVAINPPMKYLQYIIVFTGTGQGCTFLAPMALGLYWKRTTKAGALAGMLAGFLTVVGLYGLGWVDSGARAALAAHRRAVESGDIGDPPRAWQMVNEALGWLPGWGVPRLDSFAPLYPLELDPVVWGMLAALVFTVVGSLLTKPDPGLVKKFFPT